MADTKTNIFKKLAAVDTGKYSEKKMGLTYLNWGAAWALLKQECPSAYATVYEREDGRIYFDDGQTAWVKVSVTVPEAMTEHWNGEHIEVFPIMDNRNKAIPINTPALNVFAVNASIQRGVTKAIARHGLGISIYIDGDTDGIQLDDEPAALIPRAKAKQPTEKPELSLTDMKAAIIGRSRTDKDAVKAAMEEVMPGAAKLTDMPASKIAELYGKVCV